LKTKGNVRKTKRKPKENQRKSTKTKGNQRKPKETKWKTIGKPSEKH
jgi:hypothetical protein